MGVEILRVQLVTVMLVMAKPVKRYRVLLATKRFLHPNSFENTKSLDTWSFVRGARHA